MTSQGFTRDLWSMGFASHPSLYGGKDKRLFVRYGEDSPQHGSLLDSEWRTNDVSTACEHSLGKLGIPEAQTLAFSHRQLHASAASMPREAGVGS